jgi:hypothetical protein
MPADQPWRERLDERLVRLAVKVNSVLRKLLRPGALVIGIAVSLFGTGALMKQSDFPNRGIWNPGSAALTVLIACGVVAYIGYVLVVWGYARSLASREQEAQLYRACRDVASLVERHTSLNRDNIGVHVWTVRGMPGVRRLERRETFVPGDRPPTAITWRKGKGAIGRCWARGEWVLADLERLQDLARNEAAFHALPRDETFRLTWSEFISTDHYKAILAWPLYGGPEAAPKVVGCLSVDVQETGAAAQLATFRKVHRGLFVEHSAVCEAVLRHT